MNQCFVQPKHFGVAQGPGFVLNVGAGKLATKHRIQSKSGGEKSSQRRSLKRRAGTNQDAAISALRVAARAAVFDHFLPFVDAHRGPAVRKAVKQAGAEYSEGIGRFQLKEPRAAYPIGATHIGAYIRFGKTGQPRQRR